MNKIGFKNFRRFVEMPAIELGGVNMFVGGNNAGKSTVVKAMLLIADFLKNSKIQSLNDRLVFNFAGAGASEVNIDTFSRALCWKAMDETIVFYVECDNFVMEICLMNSSEKDLSYADVKYVLINHIPTSSQILLDINGSKCTVNLGASPKLSDNIQEVAEQSANYKIQIDRLQFLLTTPTVTHEEAQEMIKKISDLNTKKKELDAYLADLMAEHMHKDGEYEFNLSLDFASVGSNFISAYIRGINSYAIANQHSELLNYSDLINQIADEFDKMTQTICIEYIHAHSATQQVLFNRKNSNDYVSQSIHEFFNLRINYKTELGQELLNWINEFTGEEFDRYEIISVEGEAYRFLLHPKSWNKSKEGINLADMGRGSIQMVILFIRLATIIKKHKGGVNRPTVIVEEPEQNLHPAVQSKLAKLFLDIYQCYNIRFIIETHSEYMVRNTQVIAAEKMNLMLKPTSLVEINASQKVYYFPVEGTPYSMNYLQSGRFENEFAPGFYDQTGFMNIKLIKASKGGK